MSAPSVTALEVTRVEEVSRRRSYRMAFQGSRFHGGQVNFELDLVCRLKAPPLLDLGVGVDPIVDCRREEERGGVHLRWSG